MKKIKLVTLIIVMFLFSSCGDNNTTSMTASEITDSIISTLKIDTMSELNSDRISSYYDIDLDKLEEYSVYIEGSGGFADEVAVFQVKSNADIDTITSSIDDRISKRKKDFEDYNSEELVKIEDNLILVKGNYIFFVISEEKDKAEKIFLDAFK